MVQPNCTLAGVFECGFLTLVVAIKMNQNGFWLRSAKLSTIVAVAPLCGPTSQAPEYQHRPSGSSVK